MAPKSLKRRIDDLFSALGGPEADRPAADKIRNELMVFASMAETLENGEATREAEEKIAGLEAALEQSKSENSDLKAALQAVNAEIESFREEQKKRDEKEREMPPIQFQILKRLPSEHLGIGMSIIQISSTLSVPMDETEIHVAQLRKAGLVAEPRLDRSGMPAWQRTVAGTTLVVAKRLAGEEEGEEQEPQRQRQPDLSKPEALVLAIVAKGQGLTPNEIFERYTKAIPTIGPPIATVPMILLLLVTLRDKEMATDAPKPVPGVAPRWKILPNGVEYLAERGVF